MHQHHLELCGGSSELDRVKYVKSCFWLIVNWTYQTGKVVAVEELLVDLSIS